MTDQQIVAGRGENAEASGTLGLNFYGLYGVHVQTVASIADVGQGSGAVAWLAGNFVGPGGDAIAQLWDNNGNLGLNVYDVGSGLQGTFSTADVGQGSGAVAWLAGNFLGGSLDQIAQLWDNGGNLGLNLYGPQGTRFSFPDLGQGSGAVAWLGGDFTGSGSHEIAQLWDNGGTLGLNVYGMAGGTVQTLIASSDLGQGSGAVAWLTGDFFPSALMQIAQLWDNNGTLGLNVYEVGNGYAQTMFASSDMGEGSGAVAWLAGNFSESLSTQIAQLWDNDGTLSLMIYDYNDVNYTLEIDAFRGGNLGQGPGALAWLTGDFTGSGLTQIAQPWAS
jgi:hypothetical protein